MSVQPLITFKAGQCDVTDSESTPLKVKPESTPGYIYLYMGADDEMIHFCWRSRSKPADEAELDLIMIPGDGTFQPYTGKENSETSENVTSPTSGRIFVLKFQSSSQRHFYWLQSKPQHPGGNPSWFSQRDLKIGQVVDMLLQGEEVNVEEEMQDVAEGGGDQHGDAEDQDMEDVSGPDATRFRSNSTGGAGADATGGDIRDEGEESREGGADGGRAATTSTAAPSDASSLVQNFLQSLTGGSGSNNPTQQRQQQGQQKLYTSLSDLLTPETCLPVISTAPPPFLDNLLAHLPPRLLLMAQEADDLTGETEPTPDATAAAIAALSADQKRNILRKVLRSPQLHQSLGSLTSALREGGLPLVAQALDLKVANGGVLRGGSVPLGGGEAVEAFVEGVRRTVEEEGEGEGEGMDTS